MEQFLFYFIHWALPIIILISLLINRPHSKFGLLSTLLFNVLLLWFLFLWGQWPIAATLYLKYLLLVIIVFNFFKFFKNYRSSKRSFPKQVGSKLKNVVLIIFGLLFGFLVGKSFLGRNYKEPAVSLNFPLKEGTYYIASGGSNGVLNNHFGKGSRSQQFALDINQLGKLDMVSDGFGPSDNASHYIYGTTVNAPCDGKIIELKDGIQDNEGSSMNVSPEDGQGNYVVLDCDGIVVSMVHLKRGSVGVSLGDQVKTDDPLGQVGNSGFSQEPHLHFQAARWNKDSVMAGVPIEFEGIKPYRNSILTR
ncbi:MAG: M23 family metallopeptidase [Flavobacteriaceae bacterium]